MPTPTTLAVTSPDSIRIWLKDNWRGACLADLINAPVVIAVNPKQIDVHRRLTIRLYYPRAKRATVFNAAPLP